MQCIACEVKALKAKRFDSLRLVETLEYVPFGANRINMWFVPQKVTLDRILKNQGIVDFKREMLEFSYAVGTKKHTCKN